MNISPPPPIIELAKALVGPDVPVSLFDSINTVAGMITIKNACGKLRNAKKTTKFLIEQAFSIMLKFCINCPIKN